MSADCSIEAQGHLFKVKRSGMAPKGGGKRGKVCGFSKQSRKRFLEKLARLRSDPDPLHRPLLLTLTYPEMVDGKRAARDLEVWCKRLERRFSKVSVIWRKELQKRGVPHFHLVVHGVWRVPVEWIRATWREVIAYEGPHTVQINVSRVRDWRQLIGYVGKYMAKPQDIQAMMALLLDGGTAPFLDYGTYSAALAGRAWGVFRRANLPWDDLQEVEREFGAWVYKLKRCARRVWGGIASGGHGFTLFRDDPGAWLRLAEWFCCSPP